MEKRVSGSKSHRATAIRASSSSGGAFSPRVGQAARQVTADIGDDLGTMTDRLTASMKKTSIVQNGCCPGGPEYWLSHIVCCPAVKVRNTVAFSSTQAHAPMSYRNQLQPRLQFAQEIQAAKRKKKFPGASSLTRASCAS
jgi:uncharacterized protein (DUF2237 family)